jgi:hypothetical protein
LGPHYPDCPGPGRRRTATQMAGNRRHARMVAAGALAGCLCLAVPVALADTPMSPADGPALHGNTGVAAPPEPTPPADPNKPSVSGLPQSGRTLAVDRGTWTGADDLGQNWIRCPSTGPCIYIPGATGIAYTATNSDVGSRLKVRVRGDNHTVVGQDSYSEKDTALTAVIAAPSSAGSPASPSSQPSAKPRNVVAPGISGRVRQGEVLTAKRGTWRGTSPIRYRYRWRRCGTTCRAIPSARNSTYRLQSNDVRKTIELSVRADNRAGATTAFSARTGPVAPKRFGRVRARVTIAGRVTSRGARLSRFRVRGERGTTIAILCKGRGCPFRRLSTPTPKGGLLRVRGLQRPLRGGIAIGVRVTKLFEIGKYTRLRIRRGHFPSRIDRCLNGTRTVRCRR